MQNDNYSKAIFDDKILQIKMGQWLGILPSTYKKNSSLLMNELNNT